MPDTKPIGMVGVGSLGLAFAKNLLAKGLPVLGYRRSGLGDLVAAGGAAAPSVEAVAQAADVILTCLPSDAALAEVAPRLAAGARNGMIVVDLSTIDVPVKRAAQDTLARAGAVMLDGAVSGNPFFVARRQATIFVGGDEAAFERVRRVLEAATDSVRYAGGFGTGTALKLLASLLVPVHTLAAAEAMALGIRAGIAPQTIYDSIAGSQASSVMFETRGKAMASRDYSAFNASLSGYLRGNIAKTRALAASVGGSYPLLDALTKLYETAVASGFDAPDQSGIFEYLMKE